MLAAAAVLWPSRLASPLAGAPLDRPLEAVALGVGLAWLVIACPRAHPRFLRQPAARTLIVALLLSLRTGLMLTREAANTVYRLIVSVHEIGFKVARTGIA